MLGTDGDPRPIGVFDSGVGGLTVVKAIVDAMPYENIIYFGDTARVPYGSKSKETTLKFSEQIVRYLLTKEVKAIMVACNTVSSNCYDELSQSFEAPLFEMVGFGARAGAPLTKNKRIGVIGTEATIKSLAYERAIKEIDAEIKVFGKACPLFVPLAEEGWTNNTVAAITSEMYLQELIDKEIDTLILGCTHYPLLTNRIKKTVGSVQVVNPAIFAASEMKRFLYEREMLKNDVNKPGRKFFVSDGGGADKFKRLSRLVLGETYEPNKIDIERY